MNLDDFNVEEATHKLACVHAQGGSRKHYWMRCIKLGETRSGKVKVLVFGRMFWKGQDHVRAIRYVEADRLMAIAPAACKPEAESAA